jgi:hypothetical protein
VFWLPPFSIYESAGDKNPPALSQIENGGNQNTKQRFLPPELPQIEIRGNQNTKQRFLPPALS